MKHLRRWCAGAIVAVWPSILPAADAPHGVPDRQNGAPDSPLAALSLDRLQATRDRPLFAPSRRPPPQPIVQQMAVPVPQLPPPNMVLYGIVADHTGARAVVRSGGSAKPIRARLGDEIEGWKIIRIEPRRMVLSHDDRLVTFALFAAPSAKGAASPVAVPSPAGAWPPPPGAQERFNRRTGR